MVMMYGSLLQPEGPFRRGWLALGVTLGYKEGEHY